MYLRLFAASLVLAMFSGCASVAPSYPASVANADSAGRLEAGLAVGNFSFKKGEEATLNSIGARASSFSAPTSGSYAEYIGEAVKTDLQAAGKLDAKSPRVLTGVVEQNRLSAAGINTNDAEISVRFKVVENGNTRFDKAITARNEWDSSLLGAIAIPRAIQNYVATVQKLVGQLFADPDFKSAVGKK